MEASHRRVWMLLLLLARMLMMRGDRHGMGDGVGMGARRVGHSLRQRRGQRVLRGRDLILVRLEGHGPCVRRRLHWGRGPVVALAVLANPDDLLARLREEGVLLALEPARRRGGGGEAARGAWCRRTGRGRGSREHAHEVMSRGRGREVGWAGVGGDDDVCEGGAGQRR